MNSASITLKSLVCFSLVLFISTNAFAQTSDYKSSKIITKIENGKKTTITYENGELKSVEVDGKLLDKTEFDKYEEDGNMNMFNPFEESENSDKVNRMKRSFGDLDSVFNKLKDKMKAFNGLNNGMSFWFGGKQMNLDSMFGDWDMNFHIDSIGDITKNFKFSIPDFEDLQDYSLNFDDDDQAQKNPRKRRKTIEEDVTEGTDRMMDELRNSEKKSLTSILSDKLNKDGLLKANEINRIELNAKHLKINGDKMPEVIFEKYKKIYEGETGLSLISGNTVKFEVKGEAEKSRKLRAF
jgi:hypothetical protein